MLTVWYVYNKDKRLAGPYMVQAPATQFAVSQTRFHKRWHTEQPSLTLQVIEETYDLTSAVVKRTVTDGKVNK
jgi:hypothetical protein